MKKKILLSAFACHPQQGSEPGYGWNWATGLATRGYEEHCFTRIIAKEAILEASQSMNITFHFIQLPFGLEKLFSKGTIGMYLYYLLWQYKASNLAKNLNKKINIDLIHHISWGSIQLGSFMYRVKRPIIFGPVGGGQFSPEAFQKYFGKSWHTEVRRKKVSDLLVKFNPAFKNTLKKSHTIIVANEDTKQLATKQGNNNLVILNDIAIKDSFFSINRQSKLEGSGLNLLWIGRFMPRKGLQLVCETMYKLAACSNIKLTVVGDGIEDVRDQFLAYQAEKQLTNIHWQGKVPFEKVIDFYKTHDAFFFTSLRDSGPSQLIEAMAYGLPVITINIHGQKEIVNEANGVKVDIDNPEAISDRLAKEIIKLRDNRQELERLSIGAFDFAQKHKSSYKMDFIIDNYYPESVKNSK